MPEGVFHHGVEWQLLDTGPKPIRTAKTGVIGVVGTAPGAALAAAVLTTGVEGSNTGLTFTAADGEAGNLINVAYVDPGANSSALAVTVTGTAISVSLETDGSGDLVSTAAEVKAAVNGDTDAAALVTVTDTGASTGVGVVAALAASYLTGGHDDDFPLNTPVLLLGNRTEAAKLGSTGTLPDAMDGIFDQAIAATIVVIRVTEGVDFAATKTNILGDGASFTGVHALLSAETVTGVKPRILIVPGFTHDLAVVNEMIPLADALHAHIVADGPNTDKTDAKTYEDNFGSRRVYLVDPQVKVYDSATDSDVAKPASPRVAGVIARVHNDPAKGFWWSPSNQPIYGITGTARTVYYSGSEALAEANYLNENNVATIIRKEGFLLWGNRTTATDSRFAFLAHSVIEDILNESVTAGIEWAIDRNITTRFGEAVAQTVQQYLDRLTKLGALAGGKCWPDPDLNTPDQLLDGKVYFNLDYAPTGIAEHIVLRVEVNQEYLRDLFAQAA
ncbi:MAG: phage tail sheath subtilisin-like domain-containing protein [Gammaproteobacteria bacterium]|nr:phage tail sheath subtilisin-like domain-containing protein [Gammaproteobacteria bacterium]